MKYSIKVGWLYPKLMSTYGDRGNITVLRTRCFWRGIEMKVVGIDQNTKLKQFYEIDLFFGGGSQDAEQQIVTKSMNKGGGEVMKEQIQKGVPGLFVCGSPQILGNFYETLPEELTKGLGIFDIYTKHPGNGAKRCIGNIAMEVNFSSLFDDFSYGNQQKKIVVGFENHHGRTYLGKNVRPLGRVLAGYGNNGQDGSEGVVFKNAIGTYLHGPLLPKNPEVADLIIEKALEQKYGGKIGLSDLDDSLEIKAKESIIRQMNV